MSAEDHEFHCPSCNAQYDSKKKWWNETCANCGYRYPKKRDRVMPCPKCGKLIALIFPMHECKPKRRELVPTGLSGKLKPKKVRLKKGVVTVELTEKEAGALSLIIDNGWGNGDFKGYGGENPVTQKRAMDKLEEARRQVKRYKLKPNMKTIRDTVQWTQVHLENEVVILRGCRGFDVANENGDYLTRLPLDSAKLAVEWCEINGCYPIGTAYKAFAEPRRSVWPGCSIRPGSSRERSENKERRRPQRENNRCKPIYFGGCTKIRSTLR